MQNYWQDISQNGTTVKQMVLCLDAETISKREVQEVLSLLPVITDKDVLELGAGIGLVTYHYYHSTSTTTNVMLL